VSYHLIKRYENSFETFASFPDKTFDVTITDPPFNAHVQSNMCSGSLVGTKAVPKYDLKFAPVTKWSWVNDLVRITKRWVLIWCSVEDFGHILDATGQPPYVRGGVVYKPNAMGQLTADRPATAYEGIAILHSPGIKKRWNGRGSYAIWKCNGTRGKKLRHPNEKHVDICLKMVSLFSERGETVFDPFCGSGAIGEASLRLGRNYVGWDQDPEWIARSADRLQRQVDAVSDSDALSLCSMREPK
jgi:hypothetical protein